MKPKSPDSSLRIMDGAGIAIIAGLSALMYMGGWRPIAIARAQDRSQRQLVEEQQSHAAVLESKVRETGRTVSLVRERVASHGNMLESADNVNSRVARLADFATRSGLAINEIRPAPGVVETHFTRVPIRMTGSGPYRACILFLHRLRAEFPDTGMQSFDLTGDPTTEDAAAGFEFNFAWYAVSVTRPGEGK